MTDTRTDLQRKSDDLVRDWLKVLVPIVYSQGMGVVPQTAIFWTLPERVER